MNLIRLYGRLTIPLLALVLSGVLSSCASQPPVDSTHPLIAVTEVRNMTGDSRLNALIPNLHSELMSDLYAETPFRVVETSRLDEVLQEGQQNLSTLKLAGAQDILFVNLSRMTNGGISTGDWGGVSASNDSWTAVIDARLVSVETGVILATARASGQASRVVATIAGTTLGSTSTTQDLQVQAAEAALRLVCQQLAAAVNAPPH